MSRSASATVPLACAAALGLWAATGRSEPQTPPGAVTGQVSVVSDGDEKADRSGVVIVIEDVPGPDPEPMHAVVRQAGLRFHPALTVITTGSTVDFPNEDKVFHNVFSMSRAARFDLDLYKSGESKSVTFRRPGVVDLFCNIHSEMAAKIKVVETRYYAVTGKDGRFTIEDVPPGTYPIVAWHPHGEEYRGRIEVAPGRTSTLDPTVKLGARPRRHLRKDGTPYGRYR